MSLDKMPDVWSTSLPSLFQEYVDGLILVLQNAANCVDVPSARSKVKEALRHECMLNDKQRGFRNTQHQLLEAVKQDLDDCMTVEAMGVRLNCYLKFIESELQRRRNLPGEPY